MGYSGQLQSSFYAGRSSISSFQCNPDEPDEEHGVADYIVTGQWAKKAYVRKRRNTER